MPCLTKIAHGSTPFITTFLLIHLSAPALANLGGSSLASQTMVRTIQSFDILYLTSLPDSGKGILPN